MQEQIEALAAQGGIPNAGTNSFVQILTQQAANFLSLKKGKVVSDGNAVEGFLQVLRQCDSVALNREHRLQKIQEDTEKELQEQIMENSKLKCKIVNIQQACDIPQDGSYEERLDRLRQLIDLLKEQKEAEASAKEQVSEENERLRASAEEAEKQAENVQQQYLESLSQITSAEA